MYLLVLDLSIAMIRLKTISSCLFILLLSIVSKVDGLAVMSVDLGTVYMKIEIANPGIHKEIALNK